MLVYPLLIEELNTFFKIMLFVRAYIENVNIGGNRLIFSEHRQSCAVEDSETLVSFNVG